MHYPVSPASEWRATAPRERTKGGDIEGTEWSRGGVGGGEGSNSLGGIGRRNDSPGSLNPHDRIDVKQ